MTGSLPAGLHGEPMKDTKTGLTHKELSLANAYLENGFCELRAYEVSEYSQNCTTQTKRVNAYKILQKPHIKAYIDQKLANAAAKVEVTVENIAAEIAAVAFGSITPRLGVQSSIANKLKALELLGRFKAMFTDNVNQTDMVRQRELDEKKKAECERIAKIRLQQRIG